MRTEILHLSDENINILSTLYGQSNNKSIRNKDKLLRVLHRSMDGGLTELQRFCVEEHYINNRRQCAIAKELGVSPSTVCRHINRALEKLKIIASYYN